MTDRRRNLFVLLLVAGLLAASLVVVATKPTRLGLDLKGGVSLIYQAKPTKQSTVNSDAIDRTLDIMRERVDQLGVAEPEIQRSGAGPDRRLAPGRQERRRGRQPGRHDGADVLLRLGDERPRRQLQAGADGRERHRRLRRRAPAHRPADRRTSRAVTRASKCPAARLPERDDATALFYLVDTKAKKVLAGPDETRRDLAQEIAEQGHQARPEPAGRRGQARARSSSARESPDDKTKSDQPSTSCSDNPALSGTDIKNPEQNFDNGAGGTGAPIVTFDFTRQGPQAQWQKTTREIAQRGSQPVHPGRRPADRVPALRDRARQRADLGPVHRLQAEPGRHRRAQRLADLGRLHDQAPPSDLANLLKTGALPIKLELISSSQVSATLGKQALDQGLIAGIAGFVDRRALPARLLPHPRRDRGRRAAASTRSTSSR